MTTAPKRARWPVVSRFPSAVLWPFTVLVTCTVAAGDASSQWPQFRGPNASGVSSVARPPVKIGPDDNVQWKVDVPWSPSSPVVWGPTIFVTTWHNGELQTRCYDRATGALRWSRGVKPTELEEFHRSDGSPAASSPATDGHHVVSYFGSFGLICHTVEGVEAWRQPLPVAESMGKYGTGTSPIIVGGCVLLNRDQFRTSSLLAFDLAKGRKLWEAFRPESSGGFSTPVHWQNGRVDEIVLASNSRLTGYDLRTGGELWTVFGLTGTICTTPTVGGDRLYFAAWSNYVADTALPAWEEFYRLHDKDNDGKVSLDEPPAAQRDYLRGLDVDRDGYYTKQDWETRRQRSTRYENVLIAVEPGGRGDITESHVAWKYRKALPYVSSPLWYQDAIYFVRDGAVVTCLNARTGDPIYAQERIGRTGNYYASPIAADGRIYFASVPGQLTVVKAGGPKPEILHQADFNSRILATPALADDQVFVRTETHLWAFRP